MHGVKRLIQLKVSKVLIENSINILKSSPDKEKVILWTGEKYDGFYLAEEIFTPIQKSAQDYFRIPQEGMEQLMNHLKQTRKMLVAQLHTHPAKAFHSTTDDKWAIVRHAGAYSLVLPFFCATTSNESFLYDVATFVLSPSNEWKNVDNNNLVVV